MPLICMCNFQHYFDVQVCLHIQIKGIGLKTAAQIQQTDQYQLIQASQDHPTVKHVHL